MCESVKSQVVDKTNITRLDEIIKAVESYRTNFALFVTDIKKGNEITSLLIASGLKISNAVSVLEKKTNAAYLSELLATVYDTRLEIRTYMMTSTEEKFQFGDKTAQ